MTTHLFKNGKCTKETDIHTPLRRVLSAHRHLLMIVQVLVTLHEGGKYQDDSDMP